MTVRRREFLSTIAGAAAGSRLSTAALVAGTPPPAPPRPLPASTGPLYWSWWAWEPMDAYRRMNRVAGAVDGTAPWLGRWWDRIHSEELVRLMTGLGINLAVTHFFKGFGLRHEHDEQQRTAQLVRHAHRHGMRVLGYCQSRSLYYESFLAEEPGAEDWIQRDSSGAKMTWGKAYFRWTPCIHSGEFRAYMKRVIRHGLDEIGLDGLHFDNDYAQPCYCPRCVREFRAWLTTNCPNPRPRFGLADFRNVRLPPTQESLSRISDPLVQEWVRWRCESLGEYHRDLTAFARSVREDVILLGNPAHPRHLDSPNKLSVWAPMVGRHLTLMFAENKSCPEMIDNDLVSQIRAHKQGAAIGYRVISTTWRQESSVGEGLPDRPEDAQRQVAEAAAFGGIPGTNWALRATGAPDRVRIDRDDLRLGFGRYMRFVRANERLMAGATPVRDLAVLQTFCSQSFDPAHCYPILLGLEETLIRSGFSWETAFGDDLNRLDRFGAVALAGQSHLSDAACSAVHALARRGGGVLLVGDCGTIDPQGRARPSDPFADLDGPRVVRVDAGLARARINAQGAVQRISLPKGHARIASAVEKVLGDQWTARLLGANTVALAAYMLADGSLAVHLVNYAEKPAGNLRLALGPAWQSAREARWLTPENPEQILPVMRPQPSSSCIEIPPVHIYGLAVLRSK